MSDDLLMKLINKALLDLEYSGDIVLCSSDADTPAKHIHEVVSQLVPSGQLTTLELSGLRSLIFQAVEDESFFDWEMPTLTGLTSDEFKKLADKLPSG